MSRIPSVEQDYKGIVFKNIDDSSTQHLSRVLASVLLPLGGVMNAVKFWPSDISHSILVAWAILYLILGLMVALSIPLERHGKQKPADILEIAWVPILGAINIIIPWTVLEEIGVNPTKYHFSMTIMALVGGLGFMALLYPKLTKAIFIILPMITISSVGIFVSINDSELAGNMIFWGSAMVGATYAVSRVQTLLVDLKEESEQVARSDSLTGLLSRHGFLEDVARIQEEGNCSSLYLVLIDLDRFKSINDSLGHRYGDHVLKTVGKRLTESLPKNSSIGRLGGDEFSALLYNKSEVEASQILKQALNKIHKPIKFDDRKMHIRASIGVADLTTDGSIADVITEADQSMYRSKYNSLASVTFFDSSMRAELKKHADLERRFRSALENNEIIFYGQPIVRSSDLKPVGVELLARWPQADGTIISPDEFIPIANATGLVVDLGKQCLAKAGELLNLWSADSELNEIEIHVNISPKHLAYDLVDDVLNVLNHIDKPEKLGLEFVETDLISNIANDDNQLIALRELGVKIAIDDFGIEYSSLNYLRVLPISTIKVDKSFVSDIDTDLVNFEVVNAVLSIAKVLNLPVVAEGVESLAELDALKKLSNKILIQGYYVSRPEPITECDFTLRRLVRESRGTSTNQMLYSGVDFEMEDLNNSAQLEF